MEGELIPDNVSEKDLKAEVIRRNARAGYSTGLGEQPGRTKIMALPPNKKYEENYRKAFGHD